MKIKRIKRLKVNSYDFEVIWDTEDNGSSASFPDKKFIIGIRNNDTAEVFQSICHELMEIVAIELHVHYQRPDCRTDFIFMYDHRQHDTMMNMFAGLLSQFIK